MVLYWKFQNTPCPVITLQPIRAFKLLRQHFDNGNAKTLSFICSIPFIYPNAVILYGESYQILGFFKNNGYSATASSLKCIFESVGQKLI